MPVCEIAPVVGAPIHIRWEKSPGESFGMRGVVAEAHYDGGRNFVAMVRGRKR
jgi:hypothetical protein